MQELTYFGIGLVIAFTSFCFGFRLGEKNAKEENQTPEKELNDFLNDEPYKFL